MAPEAVNARLVTPDGKEMQIGSCLCDFGFHIHHHLVDDMLSIDFGDSYKKVLAL